MLASLNFEEMVIQVMKDGTLQFLKREEVVRKESKDEEDEVVSMEIGCLRVIRTKRF